MLPVKISASVLNSDLSRLGESAAAIAENGIEYLHFDVMDGEFVENITYGSAVQNSLKSRTTALLDTHLAYGEAVCGAPRRLTYCTAS